MLAARLIKTEKGKPETDLDKVKGDADERDQEKEPTATTPAGSVASICVYAWMLRFSMAHRWVIMTLVVLVFLSIIPLFMFVGKNFLPVDDQSQFEISVRTPEGTSLSASSQIIRADRFRNSQDAGRDGHSCDRRRRTAAGRQLRHDLREVERCRRPSRNRRK